MSHPDLALRRLLLTLVVLGMVVLPVIAIAITIHTQTTHEDVRIYDGLREGWLVAPILIPLMLLLAWNRPRHPITWVVAGLGILSGLQQLAGSYAAEALLVEGRILPGGAAAQLLYALFQTWVVFTTLALLALFPTGQMPSPRWRWLKWALVALFVISPIVDLLLPEHPFADEDPPLPPSIAQIQSPLDWEVPDALSSSVSAAGALVAGLVLIGVVAGIVVRFRRGRGVERQQFKWFFYAVMTTAGLFVITAGEQISGVDLPGPFELLLNVWAVGPTIIIAAMALAVLRYRLYDIDRIISRTVTYGLVVGLLGLAVTAFSTLAGAQFETPWVVAATTLAVAALFNPLRKRIQAQVDRRFNRSRYDAERVAETFVGSLRDQVDPQEVLESWVGTVSQTMQPSAAGVWVRSS